MSRRGLSRVSCIVCFAVGLLAIATLAAFFIFGGLKFSPPSGPETHLSCAGNRCTSVEGFGADECRNEGSFCGCLDTDSGENYSSGLNIFLQGIARNATLSSTDRCLASGHLIEYVCEGDNIATFEIACESLGNYSCISGECFPDNLEFEDCRDTDGGLNYLKDGKTSNGKVRISDYCTIEGKLVETYCSAGGSEILIDLFDCATLGNFVCQYGACVSTI